MNIETLKTEILNCQEAENAFKTDLTKGKRYLLTEVFYPFYRTPEEAGTSYLDFSAFTANELTDVYDNIDELFPLYSVIISYGALLRLINSAKPFSPESEYI